MKPLVVNAHFLKLKPDKMAVLEKRAELHRRFSSIEFKVLECKDGKLVVRVVQDKSHAGNYFDQKRLVEIVRETFGDLGAWSEVLARPIPYQPSPPAVVDSGWIKKKWRNAE